MEWFIAAVVVATLGVAAMAAAGGLGEMPKEPVRDIYRPTLPADRALTADDLHQLRFGITLRGYAMDQVDDALDRLAEELAARDARIAELSAGHPPDGGVAAGQEPRNERWAAAQPTTPEPS